MITYTTDNLEYTIGSIVTTAYMTDIDGICHYNVRAFIVRKATRQEYLDYVKEQGALIIKPIPDYATFYEVSID